MHVGASSRDLVHSDKCLRDALGENWYRDAGGAEEGTTALPVAGGGDADALPRFVAEVLG